MCELEKELDLILNAVLTGKGEITDTTVRKILELEAGIAEKRRCKWESQKTRSTIPNNRFIKTTLVNTIFSNRAHQKIESNKIRMARENRVRRNLLASRKKYRHDHRRSRSPSSRSTSPSSSSSPSPFYKRSHHKFKSNHSRSRKDPPPPLPLSHHNSDPTRAQAYPVRGGRDLNRNFEQRNRDSYRDSNRDSRRYNRDSRDSRDNNRFKVRDGYPERESDRSSLRHRSYNPLPSPRHRHNSTEQRGRNSYRSPSCSRSRSRSRLSHSSSRSDPLCSHSTSERPQQPSSSFFDLPENNQWDTEKLSLVETNLYSPAVELSPEIIHPTPKNSPRTFNDEITSMEDLKDGEVPSTLNTPSHPIRFYPRYSQSEPPLIKNENSSTVNGFNAVSDTNDVSNQKNIKVQYFQQIEEQVCIKQEFESVQQQYQQQLSSHSHPTTIKKRKLYSRSPSLSPRHDLDELIYRSKKRTKTTSESTSETTYHHHPHHHDEEEKSMQRISQMKVRGRGAVGSKMDALVLSPSSVPYDPSSPTSDKWSHSKIEQDYQPPVAATIPNSSIFVSVSDSESSEDSSCDRKKKKKKEKKLRLKEERRRKRKEKKKLAKKEEKRAKKQEREGKGVGIGVGVGVGVEAGVGRQRK